MRLDCTSGNKLATGSRDYSVSRILIIARTQLENLVNVSELQLINYFLRERFRVPSSLSLVAAQAEFSSCKFLVGRNDNFLHAECTF